MKYGGKVVQTKLLSRLSHKVCRLLSSPVLLLKFTIIIGTAELYKPSLPLLSYHPGYKFETIMFKINVVLLVLCVCLFVFWPFHKIDDL